MSDYEQDLTGELSTEEEQALAAVLSAPGLSEADTERLRGRLATAAELPLARLRQRRPPRRVPGSWWFRAAVPMAAAALLLILLGSPFRHDPGNGSSAPVAELNGTERALIADVSDAEFAQLVSGAADAEALLLLAVQQ